jgi:hypothetical protein
MWLGNQVCIHCPLLEDQGLPGFLESECRVRPEDLEPLLRDPKSGVKLAVAQGRLVGYTVFGQPRLFRNVGKLALPVDDDALLIAALYVVPDVEEEDFDIALLMDVMDFAQTQGYETVQAVCRDKDKAGPVGESSLFTAAGFEMLEGPGGACLAQTTLAAWRESFEAGEQDSA